MIKLPPDLLNAILRELGQGSSGGFTSSVVGGTVLVRQAIKSPNYVPGVSGWSINKDGSAEFNNLTVRGTFNGVNFVINSSGVFQYSPSEAANNLVYSAAPAAGTDAFGNTYLPGSVIYFTQGGGNYFAIAMNPVTGAVSYYQQSPNMSGIWGHQFDVAIANLAGIGTIYGLSMSNVPIAAPPVCWNNSLAEIDPTALAGAESFHAVTFTNSWAQAAGRVSTGFWLSVLPGLIVVEGSVVVPAGFAANQNITTAAPVAYRPTHIQSLTGWDTTGNLPVRLAWLTSGNLQFNGPVANTAATHTIDIPVQYVDLLN